MTEKRFTLAYEKGNWWAVRDGDITLWKEEVVELLNHLHEENEKLKLHLHILEEVVYMLDQEVVIAMEDGFESSDWYLNYLAKGTEDLE